MRETYENLVELTGTFAGDPFLTGDQELEAVLQVQRRSGTTDTLLIRFPEEWAETSLSGRHCRVTGQIGTWNRYTGSIRYAQPYILADYVSLTDGEDSNQINLDGYIIGKPKTRQTNGRKLCNRQMVNNNVDTHGSYISVVFWDDLAAKAAELKTGTYIRITGQLRSHQQQDRHMTEISCRILTIGKEGI